MAAFGDIGEDQLDGLARRHLERGLAVAHLVIASQLDNRLGLVGRSEGGESCQADSEKCDWNSFHFN